MRPILRAWAKSDCLDFKAAFLAAFLVLILLMPKAVFAQNVQDSILSDSAGIETLMQFESSVPDSTEPDSVAPVSAAIPDSAGMITATSIPVIQESANADSVTLTPVKSDSLISKQVLKTVLYLGGGERSPWFHLGVLYAIEEYGIPVDSIVATSWGAWVGTLWAKGEPLDEIQRVMLDPAVASVIGRNLSDSSLSQGKDDYEIPLSMGNIPSLQQRFVLSVNSAGKLERNKKGLLPDSSRNFKALARLRLQETLYRLPVTYEKPFSLQGCDANGFPEKKGNRVEDIVASLPLWEASQRSNVSAMSGELCPFYALPAEDNEHELALIVVADPLRNVEGGNSASLLLKKMASAHLKNQPGVVIRAHSIQDTARAAWIQAGFSALEKQLSSLSVLSDRRFAYGENAKKPAPPWFRFSPVFDSLSSEAHHSIKTYWDENDIGLLGPENFVRRVQKNPAYDSLLLSMQPNGDLLIGAKVHPTFDVAAGGFGSNVIGANGYLEAKLYYVNQMELELILAGFYGTSSYGVRPRLNVSKLWNKHWNLAFGFDYLMLRPLKTFNNDLRGSLRVESEERTDFMMSVAYEMDSRQTIAAEFLFGHRNYEMDSLYSAETYVKTYPVSPAIRYTYRKGNESGWFALNGFDFNLSMGLESIGFDFGVNDLVPIYWKILADGRYSVAPNSHVSFTVGAAGGIERYHEEGYGYVYPKSFDYRPLDLVYRLHAKATPWSTEWYNPELSSHEYGLIRGSASLHGSYLGAWLFAAYYHDFEESPLSELDQDKLILEPALRFSYKSVSVYAGINKIVNANSVKDLLKSSDRNYFVRVGNYSF